MADKTTLIKEVFELCNGQRNFRSWIAARADQFADNFAKTESEKNALKIHFFLIADQKMLEWMNIVAEVYAPHVTEQELSLAKTELTMNRKSGITDPPDEALSEELRGTLVKLTRLQHELDSRTHWLLQRCISTAWLAYQARN